MNGAKNPRLTAASLNDAAIERLFARHEPRIVAATTCEELLEALLDLHDAVAKRWAEATWLRSFDALLSSEINIVEFDQQLGTALMKLWAIVRGIQERHGLGDPEALTKAAMRLADAFYDRVDQVATAMGRHWGRA